MSEHPNEPVSLRWIETPDEQPRPYIVVSDDQWRRIMFGLPEVDRLHSLYHAQRYRMSVLVPTLRIDDV